MTSFTSLEAAILSAICDGRTTALRAFLDTAEVTKRENTGHGFYTYFTIQPGHVPMSLEQNHLPGPFAHMVGMGEGMIMSFELWIESGYPDCLEGFQICDSAGNTVDLHDYDLHALTFTRLDL